MTISKEEFLGWKDHPVTKEFMAFLHKERESFKEAWAQGNFRVESNPTLTHQLTQTALDKGQALEEVLNLEYEVIFGGESE